MRRALRELVGLCWESGVSADIPALAWYLLSSPVPLALGLTALAAVVLGDYAEAQTLATRVSGVLPRDVHDHVVALVLRTKRDSPLLIASAIVGMLWTSPGPWESSIAVSAGRSRSKARILCWASCGTWAWPSRWRARGHDGVAGDGRDRAGGSPSLQRHAGAPGLASSCSP